MFRIWDLLHNSATIRGYPRCVNLRRDLGFAIFRSMRTAQRPKNSTRDRMGAPIFRILKPMAVYSGCLAALLLWPIGSAEAQYKNSFVSVNAAYQPTTRKSTFDTPNLTGVSERAERSIRFLWSSRADIEFGSKITDALWVTTRGSLGLSGFGVSRRDADYQQVYDAEARDTLGPVWSAGGHLGLRYYFKTDQFRPYLQVGTSGTYYGSLKSEISVSSCPNTCSTATTETAFDEFVPYRVIWGQHIQPGIEYVTKMDFALHFYADFQNWFLLEAPDTQAVALGVGTQWYF